MSAIASLTNSGSKGTIILGEVRFWTQSCLRQCTHGAMQYLLLRCVRWGLRTGRNHALGA